MENPGAYQRKGDKDQRITQSSACDLARMVGGEIYIEDCRAETQSDQHKATCERKFLRCDEADHRQRQQVDQILILLSPILTKNQDKYDERQRPDDPNVQAGIFECILSLQLGYDILPRRKTFFTAPTTKFQFRIRCTRRIETMITAIQACRSTQLFRCSPRNVLPNP